VADILQKLVCEYSNKYHSSIKITVLKDPSPDSEKIQKRQNIWNSSYPNLLSKGA